MFTGFNSMFLQCNVYRKINMVHIERVFRFFNSRAFYFENMAGDKSMGIIFIVLHIKAVNICINFEMLK